MSVVLSSRALNIFAVAAAVAVSAAAFYVTEAAGATSGNSGSSSSSSEFWWRYPDSDCGYDDVPGSCAGNTTDECKILCDAIPGCGGFNTHGYLKKTDCLQKMKPMGSVDLYVRRSIPQPGPQPPPWGFLWPIPQQYVWTPPAGQTQKKQTLTGGGDYAGAGAGGSGIVVAKDLKIETTSKSARLARAFSRYLPLIVSGQPSPSSSPSSSSSSSSAVSSPAFTLRTVEVQVTAPDDETLNKHTNYSYTLTLDGSTSSRGIIRASSIYGAMYGLETLSQVVINGTINATHVSIVDWPDYQHRAFMADTGRRFWPVKTVKTLLDAMAYNKMSVLHLHLSDNCRYAAPSKLYPQLTARLTGNLAGHYTVEDVADIIQYAGDRGIRVVAEADMPGHSQGMQGLSGPQPGGGTGLEFCSTNGTLAFSDLYNDGAGKTVHTLKGIFGELAQLFPDDELFIGADETAPTGRCNLQNYVDIEKALTTHIVERLNKTVGGWEEYAFETSVAHSRDANYVVNTWHYHTQYEATARGFETVASNDSHFYLLYGQPYTSYWVDIASGMNASQQSLLRGGSISAWVDEYCYIAYCIHPGKYPSAHALFPPSRDAEFHESILVRLSGVNLC